MKKLSKYGSGLLIAIFLFLYVAGNIHSCRKHKDDSTLEQSGPYAVYRGLEMFWHDDFSGVDWEERLSSDTYIMVEMMTYQTDKMKLVQEKTEEFRKKVLAYPDSKILYLKNAARTLHKYLSLLRMETLAYIDSLQEGNYQFDSKEWDKGSRSLEDSVVNFYGLKELAGSNKSMDSTLMKLRMMASFGDVDQVRENKKNIETIGKAAIQWMERIFKMIFKETI